MATRKFKILLAMMLVTIIALVCAIGLVWSDIQKLNAVLDNLYWTAENTHSGVVWSMIELAEARLQQKQAVFTSLIVVMTVVLTIGSIAGLRHKLTHKVKGSNILFATVFLVSILLTLIATPIASTMTTVETHYYAGVNMDVETGSHLIQVNGYITPRATCGVASGFVACFIAITFPASYEWIGGGYFDEEGTGVVFYIEWMVDGVPGEITASGVSFGERYYIDVHRRGVSDSVGSPTPSGWGVNIHDDDGNLILSAGKDDLPQDDPVMLTPTAKGESINPDNHMGAKFSELRWTTYDPNADPEDVWGEGYWDGTKFPCSVVEDDPYSVNIIKPYYEFNVGTQNLQTFGLLSYSNGYIHYLTAPVYIDGQLVGYTGEAFLVTTDTSHEIFVDDFWEEGNTSYKYGFAFWEDASTENPRTITVEEYTIIKAYFNKEYYPPVPGDANFDGIVNMTDFDIVWEYMGTTPEQWPPGIDPDFNNDGDVDTTDIWIWLQHVDFHDVAVTSVTYALPYGATAVYPGWVIEVPVTVRNEGTYKETFDITAYYNSVAIRTKTVSNLAPKADKALTFVWHTGGVSPGNAGLDYTISAEASVVPGETGTADNTYIDGTVRVKYPGDVDGDGDVDPYDMSWFGGAYGGQYGESDYNPSCDFDGDGYVGPFDLGIFGANYGHYP